MGREYTLIGKKKVINGTVYYSPGYYDDGASFGRIFKDEKAYEKDKGAVCYIPEYGFTDATPVIIDGEEYYAEIDVCSYTREALEALLFDEDGVGYKDEDGEYLQVDAFFAMLVWAFPQTYLNELEG